LLIECTPMTVLLSPKRRLQSPMGFFFPLPSFLQSGTRGAFLSHGNGPPSGRALLFFPRTMVTCWSFSLQTSFSHVLFPRCCVRIIFLNLAQKRVEIFQSPPLIFSHEVLYRDCLDGSTFRSFFFHPSSGHNSPSLPKSPPLSQEGRRCGLFGSRTSTRK